MQFSAIKLESFFKTFVDFHLYQYVFYRVTHVSVDIKKCSSLFPKVKLAKIWTLMDNEAHIERQSVFQLQTLCNHALDGVN